MTDRIDALLASVEKPSRYMGGEFGSRTKDWDSAAIRYAFLFPDTYEVGMSHLGMKILYHTINDREDALCERVFSPWVDMEAKMREAGVPLFSIESRRPVKDFDILGVTLQYEMSYTNILAALDLAGVPLRSADRHDGPFVVAGGPCAFNPEPLAPFFDFFIIGDGERSTHEYLDVYRKWKESGAPRGEFLRMVAGIQGIYVPSFYDVRYNEDGTCAGYFPKEGTGAQMPVYKALVNDLTAADYPEQLIVPYGDVIHDRIMLEIFRGCTKGCRFCQAGMLYRPVRERSMDKLLALADKLVKTTGYDEISLMSLSSGDYSCLPELAREMVRVYQERRVRISLPSLRIDSYLKDTLAETQKVRKTALTFAAEAGTQRLRDVINKGVTEEDLMRAVGDAFDSGWNAVKLYFMIGLPTETDEDIDAIADLAAKVRKRYFAVPKEKRAPGLRITVSASVFVPKPFTPFQWAGQLDEATIIARQKRLKEKLAAVKGVDFKYHAPDVSYIEAVLARGDRKCADVLECAYRMGCHFDSWTEHFHMDMWQEAFRQAGVDPDFYALRERGTDEFFPWDALDCGVEKRYLLEEWEKALAAQTTHDCRKGCNNCGMMRYEGACRGCTAAQSYVPDAQAPVQAPAEEEKKPANAAPIRVWIRFGKKDRLKYVSHLDLQRFMQRALSRTELPFAWSQGFNPHPVMSFGSAMATGWTSEYEIMELRMTRKVDAKTVADEMSRALPPDLPVLAVCTEPAQGAPMALTQASDYAIQLDSPDAGAILAQIEEYMAKEQVVVMRKTKTGEKESDIRPMTYALRADPENPCVFYARLALTEKATLKPDLLVTTLCGMADVPVCPIRVHRLSLLDGQLQPLMH